MTKFRCSEDVRFCDMPFIALNKRGRRSVAADVGN